MSPTSRTPRPGLPVRGSTTGRAVMALFDLVGRRWILRIVWELHHAAEPPTFRELRAACGDISSSVLTRRLHELSDACLVVHDGDGYALSELGRDFVDKMQPLTQWSRVWNEALVDTEATDATRPAVDPER